MNQSELKAMAMPDPVEAARTYAEVAQRASRVIAQAMGRGASQAVPLTGDELGLTRAFVELSARLLANPYRLAEMQMHMMWDYVSLLQRSGLRLLGLDLVPPIAAPKKGDNRFRDEDWEKHFLFDFVKQSYLIAARHLHETVSHIEGMDEATRQKIEFFTRQYIDALSPTNFALTNPEVLRETVKTQGQNLIKGFNNLLQDVEAGNGRLRIRMTDSSAFELGKNVATTPGKVVFQNEMFQLIQYEPTTARQYKRPLLIVPPWINKYYILDLREKNSMVKWATDQGHTTFIISWINPDERMAEKNFEDYLLDGALQAINQVEAISGCSEINLAGYCLGGTLLMTALAYMADKNDPRAASATFFTTMLDFSEPGELGVFLDESTIGFIERRMSERGYLDGFEMANSFNLMRANDLIWSFVVNNYLMGRDPFPFDLLFWNSDSTRMPAAMHSYYLRNMYVKNLLKEPGGIEIADVTIDIGKVTTPCFFVSTVEDHIAPWKSTYMGARLPSGPVKFVLGGSGHIAGIVNPPAANKYGYWTSENNGKLPAIPEDFVASATPHDGSWWNYWHQWMTSMAGGDETVPARRPGDGGGCIIEDAPGSYVRFRLDTHKRRVSDAAIAGPLDKTDVLGGLFKRLLSPSE